MKKLSVRLRITLLYTFFMTVLTAASLFLLFSLSSREVLTSTGAELEEEVHESVEELTIQNGEVRVDSDFIRWRKAYIWRYMTNKVISYMGGFRMDLMCSRNLKTEICAN